MKEIRVEYNTYNNNDYVNIRFCNSLSEAKRLKEKLETLKHVSNIVIEEK